MLGELREIRPGLREVEGVLVTAKAREVMRRTGTSPANLVVRYERDRRGKEPTVLIGYLLSSENLPYSETSVHVAYDPELGRVVIWEEW